MNTLINSAIGVGIGVGGGCVLVILYRLAVLLGTANRWLNQQIAHGEARESREVRQHLAQ